MASKSCSRPVSSSSARDAALSASARPFPADSARTASSACAKAAVRFWCVSPSSTASASTGPASSGRPPRTWAAPSRASATGRCGARRFELDGAPGVVGHALNAQRREERGEQGGGRLQRAAAVGKGAGRVGGTGDTKGALRPDRMPARAPRSILRSPRAAGTRRARRRPADPASRAPCCAARRRRPGAPAGRRAARLGAGPRPRGHAESPRRAAPRPRTRPRPCGAAAAPRRVRAAAARRSSISLNSLW